MKKLCFGFVILIFGKNFCAAMSKSLDALPQRFHNGPGISVSKSEGDVTATQELLNEFFIFNGTKKVRAELNTKKIGDLLIKKKANPNCEQLLSIALRKKNQEVATLLLQAKADVNAINDENMDETPLHVAAANNLCLSIQGLIKHGADVNAKDRFERTPLGEAIKNKSKDAIEILMENGANTDDVDDGKSALHVALDIPGTVSDHESDISIPGLNNNATIGFLIDLGANVNVRDDNNHSSPIDVARRLGNEAAARMIEDAQEQRQLLENSPGSQFQKNVRRMNFKKKRLTPEKVSRSSSPGMSLQQSNSMNESEKPTIQNSGTKTKVFLCVAGITVCAIAAYLVYDYVKLKQKDKIREKEQNNVCNKNNLISWWSVDTEQ